MGLNLFFALTVSVVTIYYYMMRKRSQRSIEKFQHVCEKFDYSSQSEKYIVCIIVFN